MAAMDELSPSPSPSPSASASGSGSGRAGVEDGQWAPHGQLLTGCLVALNVLIALLIYFYFWRFFSRKGAAATSPGGASSQSSASSSPAVSPKPKDRQEVERAITALPVFVHSSSNNDSGDHGGKAAAAVECAICIAEFGDGEEGRMLPRCGHRFHARCVDTWFHFHTTCSLCRASVLAVAAGEPKSDMNMDTDCPV